MRKHKQFSLRDLPSCIFEALKFVICWPIILLAMIVLVLTEGDFERFEYGEYEEYW